MRISFHWALLEKPVSNVCKRYARVVSQYPAPFIIVPIVLTAILSTGIFMKLKIFRDVDYLFTPIDARWKYEEQVFYEHWARADDQFYPGKDVHRRKGLHMIVAAADGGSVLRIDQAKQFMDLLNWVENSTFVYNNTVYGYQDVCLIFQDQCYVNSHANFLARIFVNHDQVSQFQSDPIDLTMTLGGVETDPKTGVITTAKTWLISYQLKKETPLLETLSNTFETTMGKKIWRKEMPTSLLNVYFFHSNTFEEELDEGNMRIRPKFIYTFLILISFSIIGTMTTKRKDSVIVIDWVVSKPYMAIGGVLSTLLAIISAIGLGLHIGILFIDMITVVPFLILSIGIDDMFLILAGWRSTDRESAVIDRMETMMKHAGVSVTMTSLTDTLSFLIGSMAPLPAVTPICLYSACALCFNYLYIMTIFLAIVALQGRWESENRHCLTGRLTHSADEIPNLGYIARLFNVGSRPKTEKSTFVDNNRNVAAKMADNEPLDVRPWYQKFFEDVFAPILNYPIIKLISILILIAYLVISIMGIRHLTVGFNLKDIVLMDSPARGFLDLSAKYFANVNSKVDVAIDNPPDMGDPVQRKAFMKAVEALENTSCSAGRNTTDFWFFGYKRFFDQLGDSWPAILNNEKEFNQYLETFLMTEDNYGHDVLFGPEKETGGEGNMTAFRLSTKLRDTSTNNKIMACADGMRAVADAFPQYNITTYTPIWTLADQLSVILPQTLQNILIDIACMFVISLLLIPQPLCAFVVVLSILSVHIGVLGLMTWWGVNLDATSMITLAMSVGFSVDFAAHITYAYMTVGDNSRKGKITPDERVIGALGDVGWPLVQGSTATMLGVSVLGTIDWFIARTIFKTIVLVISLGVVHALVFLPVTMSLMHQGILCIKKSRHNGNSVRHMEESVQNHKHQP